MWIHWDVAAVSTTKLCGRPRLAHIISHLTSFHKRSYCSLNCSVRPANLLTLSSRPTTVDVTKVIPFLTKPHGPQACISLQHPVCFCSKTRSHLSEWSAGLLQQASLGKLLLLATVAQSQICSLCKCCKSIQMSCLAFVLFHLRHLFQTFVRPGGQGSAEEWSASNQMDS
jgi:hypothetical protein